MGWKGHTIAIVSIVALSAIMGFLWGLKRRRKYKIEEA